MKWIVQPHVKVMQGTDRVTTETCAGDSSMEPKVSLTVGKREAAEPQQRWEYEVKEEWIDHAWVEHNPTQIAMQNTLFC